MLKEMATLQIIISPFGVYFFICIFCADSNTNTACHFFLLPSRIFGVHDEAKDKAFELEMSWVCDESKRQHQKVI